MKAVLGIDCGSSAAKATLLAEDGSVLANAEHPITTRRPAPGLAEQDPQEWYAASVAAGRQCLRVAAPHSLEAIAVDGGAHCFAALDAAGQPVAQAIHWSDLRDAREVEELEAEAGRRIHHLTLEPVNSASTIAQLAWIRRNAEAAWKRIARLLVVKDYVRFRMTGKAATDPYDAAGTQLFDVRAGLWSREIAALAGVDPAWLPDVAPPHSVAGPLGGAAARDLDAGEGVPVVVGSGDSAVEAAGLGALSPGDCVLKLGSSANTETILDAPVESRAALVYPYLVDGCWIAITATGSGAAALRWFQDLMGAGGGPQPTRERRDADLAGVAEVPAGADGLLFHPFLAGERSPYWDPRLRASFAGIRAGHTRAHFYRAIMEGVAFSLRDCLDAVAVPPSGRLRLVGGAARVAPWPQIVADVLGRDLERPARSDASVGSAMLAGIGVGLFRSWADAVERSPVAAERVRARGQVRRVYEELFAVYRQAVAFHAAQGRRLSSIDEASRSVP